MNYLTSFIELFFPKNCVVCKNDLTKHEKCLCRQCSSVLPRTGFENVPDNIVEQALWGRVNLHKACSLLYYRKGEAVQKILHEIKYRGNTDLALEMGKMMGLAMKKSGFIEGVDVIIPVPLHHAKLKKRGYNQSRLLAEGIAMICDLPIVDSSVYRTVDNVTQTKKGRFERYQNIEGVFAVSDIDAINGQSVLLIDDVITTGATIEACANAIKDAKISVSTLAYAI
jgi:ComF family protein